MKLPRIVTLPQMTPYKQITHPLEYSQRYLPQSLSSVPPAGASLPPGVRKLSPREAIVLVPDDNFSHQYETQPHLQVHVQERLDTKGRERAREMGWERGR